MNVREEDKRKNSCPGRGFALAAAAIGVGVGATLYYFFNQRPENPNGEGSTTGDWQCEQPHTFAMCDEQSEDDEGSDRYSTISEHSTTDTSMEDNESTLNQESNESWNEYADTSNSESHSESSEDSHNSSSNTDNSMNTSELYSANVDDDYTVNTPNTLQSRPLLDVPVRNIEDSPMDSDSETAQEWDVTTSSAGVPSNEPIRTPIRGYLHRYAVNAQNATLSRVRDFNKTIREQAFRERSWTLEECSICFEVMLRNQEVMKLPCAHNFHSQCILPWLQEKQTCPNCRKVA